MSELKDLFEKRLGQYRDITDIILDSIPAVTDGVLQALSEEESSCLEWDDVQFEPEEDLLILIGVIRLAIGESIQLEDGREVHVTEENVETFKRIIRVAMPFELAESGTTEEVMKFFEGRKSKNYTTIDDIVGIMDEDELEEEYASASEMMTAIVGFDTKDLTEEQVKQLMFNTDDKGKIH